MKRLIYLIILAAIVSYGCDQQDKVIPNEKKLEDNTKQSTKKVDIEDTTLVKTTQDAFMTPNFDINDYQMTLGKNNTVQHSIKFNFSTEAMDYLLKNNPTIYFSFQYDFDLTKGHYIPDTKMKKLIIDSKKSFVGNTIVIKDTIDPEFDIKILEDPEKKINLIVKNKKKNIILIYADVKYFQNKKE